MVQLRYLPLLLCILALFAAMPSSAQAPGQDRPTRTFRIDRNGVGEVLPDGQVPPAPGTLTEQEIALARWYNLFRMGPPEAPMISGGLLLVLLGYLLYAGFVVGKGRTRASGSLRPTPPEGLSPAIMRMIRLMGTDPKTLAATFVSLAVKKAITLEMQGHDFAVCKAADIKVGVAQDDLLDLLNDGVPHPLAELADTMDTAPKHILATVERLAAAGYAIRNDGAALTLDPGRQPQGMQAIGLLGKDEQVVIDNVFCEHETLQITGANKGYLIPAMSELAAIESTEFQQRYYNPNASFRKAGIGLGVAAVLLALAVEFFLVGIDLFAMVFMLAGFLFLIGKVIPQWGLIIRGKVHRPAVMAGWMLLGTLITGGFFYYGVSAQGRVPLLLLLITIAAMRGNSWLGKRLKVPTPEGRRMMDDIDGFRQYLLLTPDQSRMCSQGPARTPKLFEDYLAFAIALDAEEAWARQCAALSSGPVRFDWFRGEFANLPAAAAKLGTALPYALDLALNDANNRGTDVADDEEEEEETEKPTVTK